MSYINDKINLDNVKFPDDIKNIVTNLNNFNKQNDEIKYDAEFKKLDETTRKYMTFDDKKMLHNYMLLLKKYGNFPE